MMSAKKLLEMVELNEAFSPDFAAFCEDGEVPVEFKKYLMEMVHRRDHTNTAKYLRRMADILVEPGAITPQVMQTAQQDAQATAANAPAPTSAAPNTVTNPSPYAPSAHQALQQAGLPPSSASTQQVPEAPSKWTKRPPVPGEQQPQIPAAPQVDKPIPADKASRFDNTLGTGGTDLSNQFDLGAEMKRLAANAPGGHGSMTPAQNLLKQAAGQPTQSQALTPRNAQYPQTAQPPDAEQAIQNLAQHPQTPEWVKQAINLAPKDSPNKTSKWFEWLKDMANDPNLQHNDYNNALARSPNWIKQIAMAAQQDGEDTSETAGHLEMLAGLYDNLSKQNAAKDAAARAAQPKRKQDPNMRNLLNKNLTKGLPPRSDIGTP